MSKFDRGSNETRVPDTTLFAAARTVMANERTTLSFVKTGLGLLLTGAGLLRLYGHPLLQMAGWVALGLAVLVATTGFLRYWRLRRYIGGRRDLHQLAETLADARRRPGVAGSS